ncbi:MAG: MFS transporter [Chloroflexi bacterium]|nr:MAG: MFS transporter [Chloroflexota bacterium]
MVNQLSSNSRWPLYGLLIVQLLNGIVLMPSNNFIPIYLNETMDLPVRQVAQVIAFGQVVGMFASLVGGGLSDRWGHKRVLTLGIVATALSGFAFVFRVPWIVVALWGVSGAGLGFATLSSQGYLTLAASAHTLGLFSALYNWGYTIGGAIGNPIAAVILDRGDFTILGFALVGLGLFTTLFAAILPSIHQKTDEAEPGTSVGSYKSLLNGRIALLGLLRFLPTCYYGLMVLLPLLIKQQGGSNTAVAWYAAGSAIIASLTQLVAGRMSDRWGVRYPTVISFIVILLAIGGTIITAQSVWGLYIFGAFGVSAAWALSTLLPGMVTVAAEPDIHGRVFGMLHLLWTFAMMLGTLLGGALLEINIRLPFIIVGVLNLIALGLTVPFFETKLWQKQKALTDAL